MYTCPTCGTHIDPKERCESEMGILRCMSSQGHGGWHWSQGSGPGIVRWTGLMVVHRACPERLERYGENTGWCVKPAGHEPPHNDGRGCSFAPEEEVSINA